MGMAQKDEPSERQVAESMLPIVYDELRRLAASYLRQERPDHTLEATAVVHEAYLRLAERTGTEWRGRAHFVGVVARAMRQVLVDHARAHQADKRGGGDPVLTLSEVAGLVGERPPDLLALDDAMSDLAAVDPRKVAIVELHFFGGLGFEEIARALGVSRPTVFREWKRTRLWLFHALGGEAAEGDAKIE